MYICWHHCGNIWRRLIWLPNSRNNTPASANYTSSWPKLISLNRTQFYVDEFTSKRKGKTLINLAQIGACWSEPSFLAWLSLKVTNWNHRPQIKCCQNSLFFCMYYMFYQDSRSEKQAFLAWISKNSLLQRIKKWLYESIYQVQLGQYTLQFIRSPRASHRSEYRHTTIV